MNKIRFGAVLIAVFAVMASVSKAQDLLLHFPMESADDGLGKPYSREGGAVAVPGKVGKALSFDREAVLALPFNLDHQDYPQVTVTAWVKQEDGASGSRTVFHSGSTAGLSLAVNGGTLAMRTGGPGVSYSGDKVPNGEWVFVAAVLDTGAGIARLHQNDGPPTIKDGLNINTKEPRKFLDPDDPEAGKTPYVFVGGNDFKTYYGTTRDLAIDDVRVYASALSPDLIDGLRQGAGKQRRTVSQIPEGIANPEIGRPRNAPDLDPDASSGDAQTAEAIGETEKNDAGEEESGNLGKRPGRTVEPLPGDQFDPRFLPGDQFNCREITVDEREFAKLPGDQFDSALLPGDQFDPAALPGDQFVCSRLPGDQFENTQLPGDQFACRRLPGDQFECKALPGDQFDRADLPGDQFRCGALPGDQFETSTSVDRFACVSQGDRQFPDDPPLKKSSGATGMTQQGERSVGQVPDDMKNTDIGAPSQAPELEPTDERSVGHIPDEIENPDLSRLPTGAPDPQYDSPEAAEEAAREREEAEAAAEEARDHQQGLEAAGKPRPVGEPKFSGLTGYEGEDTIRMDLRNEFLNHISWWERTNRPCRIGLNIGRQTRGCGSYSEHSHKQVSLNQDPQDLFGIGSIEVCSSFNGNKRMKGLRISGDKINKDGSTTYWPNVHTDTRPNCGEWHKAVLCPSDTLATGLIVHWNEHGLMSTKEIVGLQLICREIGLR
ncbi:LamG domain-containing protein [Hyphococcus luteus]|uniref:LamG-like jellyroll fold domain-containing protein n=1 Tax=Hyphococcus luteus TaxID=2058213 RepID=A0A2S7KAV5_9PROT|nr:LamG domain-containing protein [Marinicaulis flavus]PQA89607.1 hypothetical protein CW354_01710 [Marinicaulis flavus]